MGGQVSRMEAPVLPVGMPPAAAPLLDKPAPKVRGLSWHGRLPAALRLARRAAGRPGALYAPRDSALAATARRQPHGRSQQGLQPWLARRR